MAGGLKRYDEKVLQTTFVAGTAIAECLPVVPRRINRSRTVGPPLFPAWRLRMQGNSPGLIADNPVLRDAAPRLKRHDGGFRMRPEIDVDPLRRCVPLPVRR